MRPKSELILMWICVDILSIFDQFETNLEAQMDQVLDFWGVDCRSEGNFGVLKSDKFKVQQRRIPCLGFLKYQVSKAAIVQVSHRVVTVFFLYKLTSVKSIA